MVCHDNPFIVGENVSCNCSSDLEPTSISWFKGNQDRQICLQTINQTTLSASFFGSSEAVVKVGTEDHGLSYRCVSDTPYGTQEKSVQVQVEGTLW